MALTVTPDVAQAPRGSAARRYLLATVVAPSVPRSTERMPVHLSLVLDRSGSMDGQKIENARRAALAAIQRLESRDRFSVVAYDDQVDVLTPSTLATAESRRQAQVALEGMTARGCTDLSTGWLRGCEQVGLHLPEGAVGRVLLLTDGLANRGIRSMPELEKHASALLQRGVTTSTFGVGADFNEVLLRTMAAAGGGNFYFIETPQQIEDFITSETGEALEVVAREARLVVGVPEGCEVKILGAMPCHQEGRTLTVQLGSLISDQEVQVLLEVEMPAGESDFSLLMRVTDADGAMADEAARVVFPRVAVEACQAERKDPAVALTVARHMAARARMEALEILHRGGLADARATLFACIERVRGYAPELPDVQALVSSLEREVEALADMSVMERKKMHMTSSSVSRGRSIDGYAIKKLLRSLGFLTAVPELMQATDPARLVCHSLLDRDLWPERVTMPTAEVLVRADEEERVRALAGKFQHMPLRLLFVASRLHDNWFSHWHEAERTAVVSVADIPPALLPAFLAYEVVFHGLRLLSPEYSTGRMTHEETRGCLFDFCGVRADLEIKLHTADICPECEAKLRRFGIDVGTVREACEVIRQATHP